MELVNVVESLHHISLKKDFSPLVASVDELWIQLLQLNPSFQLDETWVSFSTRSIREDMTIEQFQLLCSALSRSKSLKFCLLEKSSIHKTNEDERVEEKVAIAIADLISENTSLKEMIIQEFSFVLDESRIIAKAISENRSLEILDIYSSYGAQVEDYAPIFEAVSQHTTLKCFGIPEFPESESSGNSFLKYMKLIISSCTPCRLQVLDIAGFLFEYPDGMDLLRSFCDELANNTSIHTLIIQDPSKEFEHHVKVYNIISHLLDKNFTLHRIGRPHSTEQFTSSVFEEVFQKLKRNYIRYLSKRALKPFSLLKLFCDNFVLSNRSQLFGGFHFPFDIIRHIFNFFIDYELLEEKDCYGHILYNYIQSYPLNSSFFYEEEYLS